MILSTLKPECRVSQESAEPRFDENYDLIVVGLGTAGSIALITAARKGLKVLGIDKLPVMGGTATAGGISSYYRGVPGGIFEELDQLAAESGRECFTETTKKFHPEAKSMALQEAAEEAGADIAFASRPIGVYLENKRVCGIRWLSPSGPRDTGSRIAIDATGDGELCAMAGCAYTHGRESDGNPQPYSHVPCWVWKVENQYRHVSQNFDAGSTVPATNGEALSEAIVHGGSLHLLESYGDEEKLLYAGRLLGLREGRQIEGEKLLRLSDYLDEKITDKPVFYESSNLDTHTQDWAFESDTVQEWLTVASLWQHEFCVPVPLETMIPVGFEGILTAGRCLSVDHDLSQAVRMQQAMQQCGEAVARAAAISLSRNIPIRKVPYPELQAELRRSGCLPVPPPDTISQQLTKDIDAVRKDLESGDSGLGIWSARQLGETARPHLRKWLSDPNSNLAKNAALALGLLNDTEALPVLRKIIRERDPHIPQNNRKLNAKRLCAALYLAGRLEDADSVENIAAILTDCIKELDVFSYAFTALLRIGAGRPEVREKVAGTVRSVLENEEFGIELPEGRCRFKEPSTAYFRIAAAGVLDRWRIPHELMRLVKPEKLTMREKGVYKKTGR